MNAALPAVPPLTDYFAVSGIPLVGAPPASTNGQQTPRRAWLRPVRKRQQSTPNGSGTTTEGSEPSPKQESSVPDVYDIFDLNAAAASVSPSTHGGSGSASARLMHSPNATVADLSHTHHLQMHQNSQQQQPQQQQPQQQQQQHTSNGKTQQQQQHATFFSSGVWMSTPPGIGGGFGTSPQGGGTGGSHATNGVHHSGDTDLLALLTLNHYDQVYELGGLYSPDSTGYTGGHTDSHAGLNGEASGMQNFIGAGNGRSPEVGL